MSNTQPNQQPQQPSQSQPSQSQPPQAPQAPQAPQGQPQAPQGQPQAAPYQPGQPYQQAPAYRQAAQQSRPAVVASKSTKLSDTNTFALVTIIMAFLSPIAAIIFGHMSLSQIKRTGDAGRGLALTGLIIGYVAAISVILFFVFYIAMIGIMFASLGNAMTGLDTYSG